MSDVLRPQPASPALAGKNRPCPCRSGKQEEPCCLRPGPHRAAARRSVKSQPAKIVRCLAKALEADGDGDFAHAIELLHCVLAQEPRSATAHHHLGLLLFDQGEIRTSLAHLQTSVEVSPEDAGFASNYGAILHRAGLHQQAAGLLKQALALDPGLPDAHFSLGHVYLSLDRPAEAAQALAEAIRLRPNFADAVNSLGVACVRLGSHQRAITCYRKALTLDASHALAHANLGASLLALGHLTAALEPLQVALQHNPDLVQAHLSLGSLHLQTGRYPETIAQCEAVLTHDPHNTDALLTLGNAYRFGGRLRLSAEICRRITQLNPNCVAAHNNLAESLRDLGDIEAAAAAYRHALALQPDYGNSASNLLYLHAFAEDVSPADALAEAQRWEDCMLPAEVRAEARAWAHPRRSEALEGNPSFPIRDLPRAKLRIGIVSPELGTHPVAEFLEPLLRKLDRERFHLTLFSTRHRTCARAARLRALADDFVSLVGVQDAQAVNLIRNKGIDVLLDTSGHTAGNRLGIFARRAAPVQCTYIGYWSTTGLSEMDWFVSDPDAPFAVESHFSEGLWRLPRIAVCYAGDPTLANTAWQPDPSGTLWLGSFNKFAKMREATFALWAKVLHVLPEAQLLLEDRGSDESDSHHRIRAGLAGHGIDPQRVNFIPYEPGHERHMLLYNRIDVALDTVPFNSGTTAFDALWMGVPLVALEGATVGSRMAASILRSLGRPEWIASTPDAYAAVVRDLARNLALRTELRATQRAQMAGSPLCDAAGLSQALQEAFFEMYSRWASTGSAPTIDSLTDSR